MVERTDLERALLDLGDHLDVPSGDDLPHRVAAAVAARPARPRLRRRRAVVATLVAGLAVGGTVATPAVGDWLGLRGVRVRQEPAPPEAEIGAALDLGERVTLEEARRRAPYPIEVPGALGPPDDVRSRLVHDQVVVTLVWNEPRALLTHVGGTVLTKFARPDTVVDEVTVDGGRALWLEGVHEVGFIIERGDVAVEPLHLADRVLLWERGPITLRLEGDLDRAESIRVAESLPR